MWTLWPRLALIVLLTWLGVEEQKGSIQGHSVLFSPFSVVTPWALSPSRLLLNLWWWYMSNLFYVTLLVGCTKSAQCAWIKVSCVVALGYLCTWGVSSVYPTYKFWKPKKKKMLGFRAGNSGIIIIAPPLSSCIILGKPCYFLRFNFHIGRWR